MIVEAVDREAWLDVAQRRAVTDALEAAWRPSWDVISVAALRQPLAVGQLPGEIRDCIVGVVGPDLSTDRQPQQEPSR